MEFDKSLNKIAGHILAAALEANFECKASLPIVDEEGFYLDVNFNNESISTKDFDKIQKLYMKLVNGANKIIYDEINKKEAQQLFATNKYLLHFLQDNNQIISFSSYKSICDKLPYELTNKPKAFKILSIGGSYWLGSDKNEQLTRIRAIAYDNNDDLNKYIEEYNDRIERDHRTIGKNLDLFNFNQTIGQGLPIWLPNGSIIRKEIRNFLSDLETKYGFQSVFSPILASTELYKISGHWDHYRENMFAQIKVDNEELVLRPMTCPHHILVYKRKPHSYKQLPIRICEESMLHRYESSGGLTGFERVREMTLEDTHIFCTPEQIESEVKNCYNIIKEAHNGLNSTIFQVDLSLHDPNDKEKFHQDEKMWKVAEDGLRKVLKACKINYVEKIGEAAFYGPKIDFQVKTTLGRIITMSTIQLDFLLPNKFDITYKDANLNDQRVVMIHLGIIGTYERLLSIILEQTKGILPLWLSPIQVVIIPVNNNLHYDYAKKVYKTLFNSKIRVEIDDRDERMSKKIREAQISKIPYQIIIGDDELNNKTISVRKYSSEDTETFEINKFKSRILKQIKDKK